MHDFETIDDVKTSFAPIIAKDASGEGMACQQTKKVRRKGSYKN
jgi:hypothetical protein